MRHAVRFFYDLQKLRIQSGLRAGSTTAELSKRHQDALEVRSDLLRQLERNALGDVRRVLRKFPIYKLWLKDQKGIGPTMAGVILAEIDISRSETVSQLWAYCGLAVATDGRAQRRVKGQKANYNPWLKSKIVKVMAECMIKANSPWRVHYDNYKHRKQHTIVDVCMACDGKGTIKNSTCKNCDGGAKPAPWGRSDAHRHQAALRYMVKMFLAELFVQWRTSLGLPVPAPYSEAVLGRKHGDHGGMGDQRDTKGAA
jgi:hypothetical protein